MILPEHEKTIATAKCPQCNRLYSSPLAADNCCSNPRRIIWPELPPQQPYKALPEPVKTQGESPRPLASVLSALYPKYYKSVVGMNEVDVYAVHKIFNINDPSGAIQHASKKLLLSGVRTGGKSLYQDIKEARDTLNRYLELNPEK